MSVKEALLEIHSLSLFTTFTPVQIASTYKQLRQFLISDVNKISTIEYYNLLELNFYLSLISGQDQEALTMLDRITDHFHEGTSQRIAILRATYLSTVQSTNAAINYLGQRDPEELLSLKKRIALSKRHIKTEDYITSLVNYLKFVPLDAETWCELGETYKEIGHFDKAIFSFEEVLLIQPFNYIIFGKIGRLYYDIYKQSSQKQGDLSHLIDSFKNFGRSVELCSNYVEGWSGIHIVCSKISTLKPKELDSIKVDYKKFLELSKTKLQEIIDEESATFTNIEYAKRVLGV